MTNFSPGAQPTMDSKVDLKIPPFSWSNFDLIQENFYLWGFSFAKLPLLFYCRPRILESTAERAIVKLPIRRRTKNHLGSMYFGAICVGVDATGGFLAAKIIRQSGKPVRLIFKDIKGQFLKRAEKDVYFVCSEGAKIRRMVDRAIETKERVSDPIRVDAFVRSDNGFEPVAEFTVTLSLKV